MTFALWSCGFPRPDAQRQPAASSDVPNTIRLWQRYSPDTFITDILELIDGIRG